jgi:NADH dehydrogenase FAD-containing subunit
MAQRGAGLPSIAGMQWSHAIARRYQILFVASRYTAAAMASKRPRIAIVGANFAGLTAAQNLGREYAVTVFDRSAAFEWLPNLHELISGVKRPADLRLSRSRLVAHQGHRFVRAEVAAIDAKAGTLATSTGQDHEFELCIVAVGGVNDTFGVSGADRCALPFKSVDNCEIIRRRLTALARRPGRKSIVIVGGGLEGIEALGEILRRYRQLESLHIRVVEAGPSLLNGSPPAIEAAIRAKCARFNVRFCTGSAVTRVTPKRVELASGESLRSDLTLWTGGAKASPLLFASGLADKRRQWAPVTSELRSRRYDNVFVIGDAAALPQALSKQAFFAMQMGEYAAANARRALAGRALREFKPSVKPMLVAFGDLETFFVSGRTVVASPALAALKEAVFQVTMAEFDPPRNISTLRDMTSRLTGAAKKLVFPTLGSYPRGKRAGHTSTRSTAR